MLRPHQEDGRYTETTVKLDDLVPEDHLVRKLDAAIDFSFIYDVVKDLYSPDHGRPSIDPVMLFKMYLIQYVFGIRSMRETVEQIRTNVAYRWFLGLSLHDPVPHHSTPSKNYARRFAGTDVFHQIFSRILKEAFEHGLVDSSVLYVDSTHVKASANKKKFTTEMAEVEAKAYQQELEKEIERDRIAHGKSPLPSEKKKKREVKVSKTDPESGLLVKNERERVFAYSYHTACDRNGWILQTYVTAANVHDSQAFFVLFERVKREIQSCPEAVCVDAGYKTPAIAKYLLEQGVKPIWPYTRPKTKDGFFRKSDFVYDEYFDCYLCPNDQVLSYSTTNREGYREYKSDPAVCRSCPYLHQCTQSKSYTKVVTRHVWQDYYEEAEHLRYVPEYRELYALRKETIERDFADMKEKHGLRWTHYRGLEKNEAQAMLVCAAMNLKKLANYLWKAKHRPFFSFAWLPILPTFFENIVYLWNKMGFRHSSETHFVNSLNGPCLFDKGHCHDQILFRSLHLAHG
ncbi:IS1182 family transposase [Geobacillus sp. FSL K6-3411]|uniref:IS1182 family transposase n=1 Tax=Geobacillus sp. FSL K6-3411 TaxID=2954614 RepID=UPI0030DD7DCF